MLHPNKQSQKIYKTKILLYFHITKDACFTIDVSVLQVLLEYHVSKFRPIYTLSLVFNKTRLQVFNKRG